LVQRIAELVENATFYSCVSALAHPAHRIDLAQTLTASITSMSTLIISLELTLARNRPLEGCLDCVPLALARLYRHIQILDLVVQLLGVQLWLPAKIHHTATSYDEHTAAQNPRHNTPLTFLLRVILSSFRSKFGTS
jgi:hypothetical protein